MKDINFLKKENVIESLSKKKGPKNLMVALFTISLILVVGAFIGEVSYDAYLSLRIKSVNKEIAGYQEVVGVEKDIKNYRENVRVLENMITILDREARFKTDTLKIIGDNCPDTIKIERYNVSEPKKLVLEGVCPDEEVILQYVERLRTSGKFSQVLITNITSIGDVTGKAPIDATSVSKFNIQLVE